MKVQFVSPYRVSKLQRYVVTVRGNVTSVPAFKPATKMGTAGSSETSVPYQSTRRHVSEGFNFQKYITFPLMNFVVIESICSCCCMSWLTWIQLLSGSFPWDTAGGQ
jgi:hypothetical protein